MAKRFAGFTPEQMGKIVPEMQGMQADEQKKFLAANPAAAARVGKMFETAQKRIGMAEGGVAISLEDRLNAQRQGFMGANQQALINQANAAFRARQAPAQKAQTAPAKSSIELARDALMQSPEYMAMQEYQQNTAPNAIDQNRVTELQTALKGSDLYKQFEQEAGTYAPQQPVNTIGYNNPVGQAPSPMTPVEPVNTIGYNNPVGQAPTPQVPIQPPQGGSSGQVPPHSHTISMADGGYIKGYAEGGDTEEEDKEATTDPVEKDKAGEAVGSLTSTMLEDPSKLASKADVDTITPEEKAAGEIGAGTGDAGDVTKAEVTKAGVTDKVGEVDAPAVIKYDPLPASAGVEDIMKRLEAATGKPSADALAEAESMDPNKLAQLGLSAAQIAEAQKVKAPDARKLEKGEMIEGSTVDMQRVKKETNFEAATGAPSSDATVQGQLTGLMEDFEGGATPAWAAGAMRQAASMMAARGLSASSMAGQAAIQAAMESALPIAQTDAATFARFEQQNLSNRQQAAMFAAEKRAEFLGLEFNQEFQTRVANAAKISDIANQNFTAEQTIALENARLAQSVDLANLSAANAKVLADAAAMSQVDLANLNNRQQAAVQNANAFLQMDMQNLSNEQQTAMFKSQQLANALLSDTAAENAAAQFNASSENQTNQFFADLNTRINTFNADQANQMERFNAGETNALAQFNTAQVNLREQFNATNALVIAQANAAWAQKITTTENAAQNEANRQLAQTENQMTALAYNSIIQQYRDRISYAWQTANNDADRATSIATSKISADASKYASDASISAANTKAAADKSTSFWNNVGTFAAAILS